MQYYPLPGQNKYHLHLVVLLTLAIALVFSLYPLANLVLRQDSYGLPSLRLAPDFQLLDANGQSKTMQSYRGRYVYLMFGYLRCADVCHSQVMNLAAIDNRLEDKKIEYLYLALDRKYDEPTQLREYFDRRGENFTSLHAQSLAQMQSVANAFHAGYRIDGNPNGDYSKIEHPARIFLIGPDGRLNYSYNGIALDINRIADDFIRLNPDINEITT